MTDQDTKRKIETALKSFSSGNISQSSLALFATLGYNTTRQNPFVKKTIAEFEENFGHAFAEKNFNKEKARFAEWKSVDLLFQLSREELSGQQGLFDSNKINWEGEDEKTVIETYLFFAIELTQPEYSRTLLAQVTREVNKIFPMPVMIIFRHGQNLTLSIIDRRLHKRDAQKDVLKKVTLIKDISIGSPHRAHLEILFDLSLEELRRVYKFTNFVELHNAWRKTLDTKELNKRFYSELSNWYFWAMDHVSFPDDVEKNEDIRNATSLIRLITRIIFIWFIKEKDLVPDVLFNHNELNRILKAFDRNKKSNSYYRAILQNLFFGTLNQTMNERGFAHEGSFQENRNNYGVKNLFRYAGDFAVEEKEALALFKDIPFLNGGLFDCLDKENDQDKVVYGDGFSRNPKKQAVVPDFLFFGAEEEYDLNAIFGTRNKRYKVKGLFNILSAYKFTVAENTPVEEEVALDPELLGRVFENLLASYNPETQTTARKQTGSFYTPREIVNYMVDESLKAYLKQNLEADAEMKPEDADAGLEILFSYTEKEHAFTDSETKTLIHAIDNCKILDPACGSGAFPMGVLHKLVHVLHKLDPHNEKWKERQIEKARQLDDPAIREQSIANIESAFANNELDYGRKLYLIENCIYGIDIQPIAVQIAKLRFFISLVVDQKKQPTKNNLGILSLPNLETKFVAANTLIGLNKPQTGGQVSLKDSEIAGLEDDLKSLRHQYFNARTRREKLACQKKDRDLRQKIATLLIKDNWNKDSAHQVAAFDPYDQNASSPFFDPEWMFGITDGFDVVIGNPPYVVSKDKCLKIIYAESVYGRPNLYGYFIHCSLEKLLNSGGILSFINPRTILTDAYFKGLRKFISKKYCVNSIVNIVDRRNVFESVLQACILNTYKNQKQSEFIKVKEIMTKDDLLTKEYNNIKSVSFFYGEEDKIYLVAESKKHYSILNKTIKLKTLSDYGFEFTTGKIQWDAWANYLSEKASKNATRLIWAENIQHYLFAPNRNRDQVFINKSIAPINPIKESTIIAQRITAVEQAYRIIATLINPEDFDLPIQCENHTSYLEKINREIPLFSILSILNSKLMDWFFRHINSNTQVSSGELNILPIPNLLANKSFVELSTIIARYVITVARIESKIVSFFEPLIDAMVYELYFPEEIISTGCQVLKHLTNLPELKDGWSDKKKLEVIGKVDQELSDEKHPVSIAMARQKTVPEVRIIEGLDH